MSTEERAELKAESLKVEAEKIALELVSHAKETARQMLLAVNLDTSQIPLICNRINRIEERLTLMQWLLFGIVTGIGAIVVALIINVLSK